MTSQCIDLAISDHIAVVTLNRPPVNALVRQSYREIEEIFNGLTTNLDVWVAILTGAGNRAFCGGNDVHEFSSTDKADIMAGYRILENAFQAIYRCEVPVIGAINGPALGSGMSLCGVCDVLVSAPEAVFGIPELTVGAIGGARFLQRLVPQQKARWMAYTGQRVPAEEMFRLGALEKIVSREQLMDTAMEMARKVCASPPAGIRLQKRALNDIEWLNLYEGNRREHDYAEILRPTADALEASRAFLEKRPPRYGR